MKNVDFKPLEFEGNENRAGLNQWRLSLFNIKSFENQAKILRDEAQESLALL